MRAVGRRRPGRARGRSTRAAARARRRARVVDDARGRRRPGSAAAAPSARPRRRTRAAASAGTRGESVRLIDGAATRCPRRPTSAPRPSAWARPLKARSPRKSSSVADGVVARARPGSRPGASSTGSSRRDLAAAARRDRRRVDRAAPRPPRPSPSRCGRVVARDDLHVGVGHRVAQRARPADDAIAVSTSPAVQIPNASRPRSAQRGERGAQRRAGQRRVERGGRGVVAVVARPRRRRRGQARVLAGPPAAAAAARAAASARARDVAQRRRRRGRFVAALPVWPSWTRRIETVVSSTCGRLRRARAGEARQQRALAGDRGLRLAVGEPERALGQLERRLARSRHADLDVAKARRRGAVRDGHDLAGLALAAVRQAPQPPLVRRRRPRRASPRSAGVTPA